MCESRNSKERFLPWEISPIGRSVTDSRPACCIYPSPLLASRITPDFSRCTPFYASLSSLTSCAPCRHLHRKSPRPSHRGPWRVFYVNAARSNATGNIHARTASRYVTLTLELQVSTSCGSPSTAERCLLPTLTRNDSAVSPLVFSYRAQHLPLTMKLTSHGTSPKLRAALAFQPQCEKGDVQMQSSRRDSRDAKNSWPNMLLQVRNPWTTRAP